VFAHHQVDSLFAFYWCGER